VGFKLILLRLRQLKPEMSTEAQILKQVEFYFSDHNLPRDKFLKGLVDKDPEGWVDISVIASFARMKKLSTDIKVIVAALKSSPNLLAVSEDDAKVKRTSKLPEKVDVLACSSYAKGFPADTSLDQIQDFIGGLLQEGEQLAAVRMRRLKDKVFKGSVFLEFNTKAAAERVAGLTATFTGASEPLLMMTKAAYLDMKKKERGDKPGNKKRKAEGKEDEKEDESFTEGLIVAVSKLPEGASRETVKEAFENLDCKIAFVEYARGQPSGFVRVAEDSEVSAAAVVTKMQEQKTEVSGACVEVKLVEGEEEKTYWAKVREAKKNKASGYHKGNKKFKGSNK